MELSNFTGQPCKSRIAYEFVPEKRNNLDLKKIAQTLEQNSVFIDLESPHLLMVKIAGTNVSLFKSGKLIVKNTNDKKEARKIAEKLISKIKTPKK